MRLPADAPARTITLPLRLRPSTPRRRRCRRAPGAGLLKNTGSRGLGIGFARPVTAPDNAIRLADLPWHRVADGAQAARIALTSPGAVAIRIDLALKGAPSELERALQGVAQRRARPSGPTLPRHRARRGVLVTGSRRRNRDHRVRIAGDGRRRQRDARNADDLAPRCSGRRAQGAGLLHRPGGSVPDGCRLPGADAPAAARHGDQRGRENLRHRQGRYVDLLGDAAQRLPRARSLRTS